MIYNPENIRLREVDSRSGRRFKVSYYFRSLDVRNGGNPVRPRWVSLRLNCFLCVRGV